MSTGGTKCPAPSAKKVSKKDSRKLPNTLKLPDKFSKSYFNDMKERPVKPTKFLCRPSMATLGVLEGVIALFQNIGWGDFLNLCAPTYRLPTLEFLATLTRDTSTQTLRFCVQGKAHELTYSQLNGFMGTPTEGTFPEGVDYPSEINFLTMWTQISGITSFATGKDKVLSIIHPCFRIAHRILSCTIFARKEAGQILVVELFFLWCMTRHDGPKPDFASFFYHKCITTRSKPSGEICFGGLITIITSELGVSLSDFHDPVADSIFLDLSALTRMRQICPRSFTQFVWLHSPIPFLTSFSLMPGLGTLTITTPPLGDPHVLFSLVHQWRRMSRKTSRWMIHPCNLLISGHRPHSHHHISRMTFSHALTTLYSRPHRIPRICSTFVHSRRSRTVRLLRFGSTTAGVGTFRPLITRYSRFFLPFP